LPAGTTVVACAAEMSTPEMIVDAKIPVPAAIAIFLKGWPRFISILLHLHLLSLLKEFQESTAF
jgi:hypothetical protein